MWIPQGLPSTNQGEIVPSLFWLGFSFRDICIIRWLKANNNDIKTYGSIVTFYL